MGNTYQHKSVDDEMILEIKNSYLNNIDLEKKFLSMLILKPNLIMEAQESIKQDYFLYNVNRAIYKAMLKISFATTKELASPHSDLSFSYDLIYSMNTNELSAALIKKTINSFGYNNLVDYYDNVVNFSKSTKDFSDILSILKNNGIRVKSYRAFRSSQVEMINTEEDKSIENIIEENTKTQTDILINACGTKKIQTIDVACNNYIERTIKRVEAGAPLGISTGFSVLDNAVNLLRRGNMYVFAARPKTGKTSFLLKLASNIVEQNIPCLYIDTEMETEQEIVPRLLSLYSRVNNYWIINGSFVRIPAERESIMLANDRISSLPFYHVYKPGISLPELVSLIKMWILRNVGTYIDPITGQSRTKDCVVIFDYLKVVKRSKFIKDYQLLGEMTTVLKDLAGRYGFPCITAVQNNRASVKDMDGDVINAEIAVAGSDEILQYTNYLFFMDKIRSYKRIENGINNGVYSSYLPGMTAEKFKAMFNNAVAEIDEKSKYKQMTSLMGNRLLSLVAGRQSEAHEDNNFFTMNMEFEYSDLNFTGELAYSPLGMPKRGGK